MGNVPQKPLGNIVSNTNDRVVANKASGGVQSNEEIGRQFQEHVNASANEMGTVDEINGIGSKPQQTPPTNISTYDAHSSDLESRNRAPNIEKSSKEMIPSRQDRTKLQENSQGLSDNTVSQVKSKSHNDSRKTTTWKQVKSTSNGLTNNETKQKVKNESTYKNITSETPRDSNKDRAGKEGHSNLGTSMSVVTHDQFNSMNPNRKRVPERTETVKDKIEPHRKVRPNSEPVPNAKNTAEEKRIVFNGKITERKVRSEALLAKEEILSMSRIQSNPKAVISDKASSRVRQPSSRILSNSEAVITDKASNRVRQPSSRIQSNSEAITTDKASDRVLQPSSSTRLASRKIKSESHPEQETFVSRRQIQSDPVHKITESKRVRMSVVQEDDNELEQSREVSSLSASSQELNFTEFNEEIDTKMQLEHDDSSSLRSTALDSRLFESQSTIISHTSGVRIPVPASRYTDNKQKLKERLLELYKFHGFDLPEFSLLPPSSNGKKLKLRPLRMTKKRPIREEDLETLSDTDLLDKEKFTNAQHIQSLYDMFHNGIKDTKNIYIVGEPGSGRTTVCRHIIQRWCAVHKIKLNVHEGVDAKEANTPALRTSRDDVQSKRSTDADFKIISHKAAGDTDHAEEDESSEQLLEDKQSLEKFEYLFYIPLCYNKSRESIQDMIKTQFKHILSNLDLEDGVKGSKSRPGESGAFPNEVFEKESGNVLIILDGLEEWKPRSKRFQHHKKVTLVPDQDTTKGFTIVTTCSPQTIQQSGLNFKDTDLVINIFGLEAESTTALATDIVQRLNESYGKNEDPENFFSQLEKSTVSKFNVWPFIVQQMVFLWYHSGTIGDTMCDVFSRIIELQMKKISDLIDDPVDNHRASSVSGPVVDHEVILPRYFVKLIHCQRHKNLIYYLSKMAWTTRKELEKMFDSTNLELHGIQFADIQMCIQAGLLMQDSFVGFSQLEHGRTVSFSNKLMQEFLSATYLAMLCRDETYDNIGKVPDHSNRMQAFVNAHLSFMLQSVKDTIYFSNLIAMLCGLYPPTVKQISKRIYNTVAKDKLVEVYRNNIKADNALVLSIQKAIFQCAHESTAVSEDEIHIHIGDLIFQEYIVEHIRYVVPEDVRSLYIMSRGFERNQENQETLSKFIHQCRVFDQLEKLAIDDSLVVFTIRDVDSLFILSERCAPILKICAFELRDNKYGTYTRITQNLDKLLPKMPVLQAVEITGLELGHNRFSTFSEVVSGLLQLRHVDLSDITCEVTKCDGEEHPFDFSDHDRLEFLALDGREIHVRGLNTSGLRQCILGDLAQSVELAILLSLRGSARLDKFVQTLTLRHRPSFASRSVIETINTWTKITTVNITSVNIGGNEFRLDSKLSVLMHIGLFEVSMIRNVWYQFIDSLPRMPQSVNIATRDLTITPIGQDLTRDSLSRPIDPESRAFILAKHTENKLALDYVRKNTSLFSVTLDITNVFCFETNK